MLSRSVSIRRVFHLAHIVFRVSYSLAECAVSLCSKTLYMFHKGERAREGEC